MHVCMHVCMLYLGGLVHVQGMYSEGEGIMYERRVKGREKKEGMRSRAMSWLTGSSLQWL